MSKWFKRTAGSDRKIYGFREYGCVENGVFMFAAFIFLKAVFYVLDKKQLP